MNVKKLFLLLALTASSFMGNLNAQNRMVRILQNGNVVQSYPVEQIDSIVIDEVMDAPTGLVASVEGRSVVLTWNAVPDATFDVCRSADDKVYTTLAVNVNTNRYVDNAPIAGTNYYKVKAKAGGHESSLSETPAIVTMTTSEQESGIYLGVMSFNQALYTQPIALLNQQTKTTYEDFIEGMTMKNGTVLCYSVDQAINALQSVSLPADLSTVALVTFTDGLDQGSLMIDSRYDIDDDFLAAIKSRITSETVAGQNMTAFSIGLRGSDVTSADDIAKFRSTLKLLASSDANATEVSNMAEVNAKFQEIAEQLNRSTYIQTVTLKIPGISNGTRIRFTFDNVSSAGLSNTYIEGTFNLRDRSLTDVEYHGMTSTSGTTIMGVTDGIFVTFTFDGIHTDDNKLLSKEYIDEWYFTSASSWQINSEFDPDEQPDVVNEKSSAVIMLVLDCSSSLGSQFPTAKSNAKSFINTLCQSTGSDNSGDDDNKKNNDPTLYSTQPQDLTLAVVWDGVRYFLTQEEYAKANLSRATIEGLTISFGGQQFVVALEDEPIDNVYGDYAITFYGERLPNISQAKVLSARWSVVNNALTAFGGKMLNGSWTCSKDTSYSSGDIYYYLSNNGGGVYSSSQGNKRPVRLVTSVESVAPVVWRDPLEYHLAARKGNSMEYFSMEEWTFIVDKSAYEKIGVVLQDSEKNRFILALQNEGVDDLYAENAVEYYGVNLPNYNQARGISARWSVVNNALTAFGGKVLNGSWTCSKDTGSGNGYYYYLTNNGGGVYSSSQWNKKPVRLVYPFEEE